MRQIIKQILPARAVRMLRRIRGAFTKTVLSYPDVIEPGAVLYKICDRLGYRLTQDPTEAADVIINWEDCSFRKAYTVLEERSRRQRILNLGCTDISKRRVEEIHQAVFGYGLAVDPLRHQGPCVKKSNLNAAHDGMIIQCPIDTVDDAYVYQKVIDNRPDELHVEDIRVPVFGEIIPFCYLKRRPIETRFSNENRTARLSEVDSVLSKRDVQLILELCRRIGLDYGELDVLRDKTDGRLYVVDVNNTPWGPPNHLESQSVPVALERLSNAFERAFVRPSSGPGWRPRMLSFLRQGQRPSRLDRAPSPNQASSRQ